MKSNYLFKTAIIFFAGASFLPPSGHCAAGDDSESRQSRITPTVQAIAKVLPSVVNLSTEKIIDAVPQSLENPGSIFNNAPEETLFDKQKGYSLGSGCIIDKSGLVVTNAHVVYRAIKINITLNDGKSYFAEVLAADDLNDIALLKINGINGDLKPIPLADPGDLLLGETVIVVGNPFGLGSTISQGVLSAVGRKVTHNEQVVFSDLLQTDAAVYPGSSGGPLINITGAMIGINTAILRDAKGIGFAIPLQRVENVLAAWLIPERFANVSLGIIPAVQRMKDGDLVIFLKDVIKDSPAWEAGLRTGDRVVKADDVELDDLMKLSGKLWKMQAGDKIMITTAGNKSFKLKVEKMLPADGGRLCEVKLGITVQPLTKDLALALHYPFSGGLVVSGLPESGIKDVERGDVLLRLGDIAVNNTNDITRAIKDRHFGDTIPALLVSVHNEYGRYLLQRKIVEMQIK
ncbi:MAG: trypsin-like peptidase domain-containing protein [Victivallaceae bacterium]|jgi:serine protease Do